MAYIPDFKHFCISDVQFSNIYCSWFSAKSIQNINENLRENWIILDFSLNPLLKYLTLIFLDFCFKVQFIVSLIEMSNQKNLKLSESQVYMTIS